MTENVKPPHFRSFHKCQILAVISTPRENVDFLLIRNNGQKIRFKWLYEAGAKDILAPDYREL